jgi:hypothetical protein
MANRGSPFSCFLGNLVLPHQIILLFHDWVHRDRSDNGSHMVLSETLFGL